VDPKTGNDYLLTVQYPEGRVRSIEDLAAIPLRGSSQEHPTHLSTVSTLRHIKAPTEVDHYQLRRVTDVYVAPVGEDLGSLSQAVNQIVARIAAPPGIRITLRGVVEGMHNTFRSFGFGLILAVLLVYLILVAQFRSFVDPLLILLAVPSGIAGVVLTLLATGTTLNVMSLMGLVMVVGIVVGNSILIFDGIQQLRRRGDPLAHAIRSASSARLRPVLITSLATFVGLVPMAVKLGTGSEAYAPLALAIIGGLALSVVLTVFVLPAAYFVVYHGRENHLLGAVHTVAGGGAE
jgi:multidrug efflux pump subunit AcrB